jgi:Clp amino terminal domain, pathogenicity island component
MSAQRRQAEYHPWTTYIDAREEARRRGDRKVGTEHLVLALLLEPEVASTLGTDVEAARAALEEIDREALAAIGFDMGKISPLAPPEARPRPPRKPTVKAVLHDRLPLTPAAKAALRESSTGLRRGRPHPGPAHVLACLLRLERPDPAAELFARLGIDPDATSRGPEA